MISDFTPSTVGATYTYHFCVYSDQRDNFGNGKCEQCDRGRKAKKDALAALS